jgi:hypothetical protein
MRIPLDNALNLKAEWTRTGTLCGQMSGVVLMKLGEMAARQSGGDAVEFEPKWSSESTERHDHDAAEAEI